MSKIAIPLLRKIWRPIDMGEHMHNKRDRASYITKNVNVAVPCRVFVRSKMAFNAFLRNVC